MLFLKNYHSAKFNFKRPDRSQDMVFAFSPITTVGTRGSKVLTKNYFVRTCSQKPTIPQNLISNVPIELQILSPAPLKGHMDKNFN